MRGPCVGYGREAAASKGSWLGRGGGNAPSPWNQHRDEDEIRNLTNMIKCLIGIVGKHAHFHIFNVAKGLNRIEDRGKKYLRNA
jgi:hypothetical protein